jgi:ribosome-associated protein
MEGTLSETEAVPAESMLAPANLSGTAAALADLLRDHKGADALVLDLREMAAWTDFFVIATSTSNTHMDGLDRHIKEFCDERGIDILRRSHKPKGEDAPQPSPQGIEPEVRGSPLEWRIIDLGPIVIHLMSSRARAFYDLERLFSLAGSGGHSPLPGKKQ